LAARLAPTAFPPDQTPAETPDLIGPMKGMLPVELTQLKRPVSAYLLDNLHYTFAGFNFPPTFLDLLLEVGISRIASPMRWTSPSISRK